MPDSPRTNAGGNLLGTVEMGLSGIQLSGVVTDPDGNLVMIAWSVVEKPEGASVDFLDASDPGTTVTVDIEGLYVLNLFAEDAEGQVGRDNMEILIYDNVCEAAQNNPDGYIPLEADFVLDCEINIKDFASLASEWLAVNGLEEYSSYEEDIIIRNLVINPGFETGDETGWDVWGSDYFPIIDSEEQRSGSYCGMAEANHGYAQWFYPKQGSTYEFSCYYKGTVRPGNGWWGCYTPDKTSGIVFVDIPANFTDEYQKATQLHTIPHDWPYPALHVWTWVMPGSQGVAYFDDFEIIEVASSVDMDISKAHNPEPADNSEDAAVEDLTLSWKTALDPNTLVINPNVTGHNLYVSMDPNLPGPAIEIGIDVDPADGNPDETASYTLTESLLRDEVYYWRVDERLESDANVITGDVWTFKTQTYGPQVDSGLNWVAWLEGGEATVQLDATVTDPTGDLSSILWSEVEVPADSTVLFVPNATVEDPTVTVDTVGEYFLKLEAEDAEGSTDEELLLLSVYADECEAARNHPDIFEQLAGDVTSDCEVNIDDFAVLIEGWMEFNYLTDIWTYDDDIHVDMNGYLVNGGFETGDTTGWYSAGGLVIDEYPYAGSYAFAMEDVGGIFQDIVLDAGNYTLTFWTRGDISTGYFHYGLEDSEGVTLTGGSFEVDSEYSEIDGGSFSVASDGTEVSFWFWGGGNNSTTGVCVVDEVWLVKDE
jgi:hypothetical protein